MAARTKMLPIMDVSINGAFKTQFTMLIVSGEELQSSLAKSSMFSLLAILERLVLGILGG